ncbi:hypothetical protein HETIRDRAFT_424623 [Heterobasidion irregulare TC 32-1]|uniref:Uncharacterized protein n=1 Tax=Heterobasidion irregulare (strain TC 32-1) TaxID=747525 RepID=W4KHS0_HETIT|nr:uncharacterized protein HETIRDRAFT_424623 [Heterobasidion irregulare TC 32-1]ETW85259.1 hypothetical protein HETIRDRAFT_424623 [Heterobasidion irregulare TC 32-1]
MVFVDAAATSMLLFVSGVQASTKMLILQQMSMLTFMPGIGTLEQIQDEREQSYHNIMATIFTQAQGSSTTTGSKSSTANARLTLAQIDLTRMDEDNNNNGAFEDHACTLTSADRNGASIIGLA